MRRKDRFEENPNREETVELADALNALSDRLDDLAPGEKSFGTVSRYASQHATEEGARTVARGGYNLAPRPGESRGYATKNGIALQMKAMAEGTGSAGGFLVQTQVADEILRAIHRRAAVNRLGVRTFDFRGKTLTLNGVSTGVTASYRAENAAIPTSEPTLTQEIKMTPKFLSALVPVSNTLLEDAADNPDAEELIRDLIVEAIVRRRDLAFIEGPGSSGSPLGIKNAAGIVTNAVDTGTNGRSPTFDDILDLLAWGRTTNVVWDSAAFLANGRLIASLAKLKTADGEYLARSGILDYSADGDEATILGVPLIPSDQIPLNITKGTSSDTSYLLFSPSWRSSTWIGEKAELRIEVSREASYTTDGGTTWISAFQHDQTLFRATTVHDLAVVRPTMVAYVDGIRP